MKPVHMKIATDRLTIAQHVLNLALSLVPSPDPIGEAIEESILAAGKAKAMIAKAEKEAEKHEPA